MRLLMRILSIFFLLLLTASSLAWYFWYRPKFNPAKNSQPFSLHKADENKALMERLKQKAAGAIAYVRGAHFEEQYCFLLDMRIASGKKRFFVYNLEKDSIEKAGLVTHGTGSDKGDEMYFSNTPNSNCTSLGKYKVGKSYYGNFGLAYKLYGLESSNSKAFERYVVLHSHSCVPVGEVYPVGICESWGCPTVAPAFLQELKKYIDKAEKPVLLWIYY